MTRTEGILFYLIGTAMVAGALTWRVGWIGLLCSGLAVLLTVLVFTDFAPQQQEVDRE